MAIAPTAYQLRARNIAADSENKIHDDRVARTHGFAGALVPGVELFAYLTHPLVATWGTAFLRSGRLAVRFRKPVYDGEDVVVSCTESDVGWQVAMVGADGEPRVTGLALPDDPAAVPDEIPFHEGTGALLPTGPDPLPLGSLSTISEPVDAERHRVYLDDIGERLGVYRVSGVLHPGAALRAVNALLVRNVDLGPWIHTASDCRFLATAGVPTTLEVRGEVVEVFERNENQWVRYDAVVRADGAPVMFVRHSAIYRLAAAGPVSATGERPERRPSRWRVSGRGSAR